MFDAISVRDACIRWIRDFFAANGPECNAVVGISGGKDSSVVAALCVEALGRARVIGVLMPNGVQDDFDAAQLLVDFLGIRHYVVNIRDAVDGLEDDQLQLVAVVSSLARPAAASFDITWPKTVAAFDSGLDSTMPSLLK